MRKFKFLFLFLLFLLLTACGGGKSDAARAVEGYYNALIAQDSAGFDALVCPDFAGDAGTEFASFAGVESELDGMSCSQTGTEGQTALVQCQGKIVATYGTEKMEIPLGDRTYRVVNQDGAWRVCGY